MLTVRKLLKRWWPYGTFALGLLLLVVFSTFAPSYEDCAANYEKQYSDPEKGKAPPEVHRSFSERAFIFAECQGEFIHVNEGVITAISTIFIALFTLALWRSTDNLWEAGEKQGSLTRQSVDLARAEFNASHRTWLKVYPVAAGPLKFDGEKMTLTITIEAQNVGQNPAVRVFLGCAMYRSHQFVAGPTEVAALVEWEKLVHSHPNAGSGEVLVPLEKTRGQFTVNDVQISASLEDRAKGFGVPAQDVKRTLSFSYCVLYKSLVSDDWRVSAHAGWLTKIDRSEFDPALGDVPADKIRIGSGMTNVIT
jgi:hypothetical protein